jgi:hypothetical protein
MKRKALWVVKLKAAKKERVMRRRTFNAAARGLEKVEKTIAELEMKIGRDDVAPTEQRVERNE